MSLLYSILHGFLRLVNFILWMPISLFVEKPYHRAKEKLRTKR